MKCLQLIFAPDLAVVSIIGVSASRELTVLSSPGHVHEVFTATCTIILGLSVHLLTSYKEITHLAIRNATPSLPVDQFYHFIYLYSQLVLRLKDFDQLIYFSKESN